MRSGTRQRLIPSLETLNKALDDAQEDDMSWRAQLALYVLCKILWLILSDAYCGSLEGSQWPMKMQAGRMMQ